MRLIQTFLLAVLLVSCGADTGDQNNPVREIAPVDQLPERTLNATEIPTVVYNPALVVETSDCIFDPTTQTDAFLKGIPEFQGYSWNPITKRAWIPLDEHWDLSIFRGGCVHFAVQADLVFDQHLDYKADKELIHEKMFWLAEHIEGLDQTVVSQAFSNHELVKEGSEARYSYQMQDDAAYQNYEMSFYVDGNGSHIYLSYFIN